MHDTIFHKSMEQGMTCWYFFFNFIFDFFTVFFWGDPPAFLGMEVMESFVSLKHQKTREYLNYNNNANGIE